MKEINLLDCTFRDGGYINDWKFGRDTIINVFERQVSSGVEFIEVGFIDDRRKFDFDHTIQPDTASFDKIFGKLDHGNSQVVAMIDYGTCSIDNISPCKDSCLDGIRVIFKKNIMYKAMEYCRQLKQLGYKVFSQAVSITSYNEEELLELIKLINDVHPYAMSMVDTYGLVDSAILKKLIKLIDSHLDHDICMGFHAHNNFQLGYSNAITMLTSGIDREILVDGSLYGMGKSAGNAPIELIAMYMNAHCNKNYNIEQMQEAIATSLLDIFRIEPWGYTLFYYIAASNKVHPEYVSYLMNKRTLSVSAVNEILQKIPDEEKLGKNIKMLESLYLEYQNENCNDNDAINKLQEKIANNNLLILGPGASVNKEEERIDKYIEEESPMVISINYVPWNRKIDMLFLTNSLRYRQMASRLAEDSFKFLPIIATSNVTKTEGIFDYVTNYSSLIDVNALVPDNSLIMLMKLLNKIGVKKIALAGFDGYSASEINYFQSGMEYEFAIKHAEELNQYVKDYFNKLKKSIDIEFITNSYYE